MPTNLTEAGAAAALVPVAGAGLFLGLGTGQAPAGLTGEASGGGYARVAIGTITRTGRQATNAAAIVFTGFSATLGAFTHCGVFTAASGGDCFWVGSLNAAVNIIAGGSITLQAGELDLEMAAVA
jgi:hypothetical protein